MNQLEHRQDHEKIHPLAVHATRAFDQLIHDSGVKADWLALMLKLESGAVSNYRHGSRPVPLWVAAAVDIQLGEPVMLRCMAEMEGFDLVKREEVPA